MNESPRLPIEEAAKFIANSFTNEYRSKCIAHWRQLHGDDYADAVKTMAWELIKKKRK